MKKLFIILISIVSIQYQVVAQGCVAIRSNGGTCAMADHHFIKENNGSSWILGINNRYFKSFRHFVGKDEQKQRVDQGTEVINHVFSSELSLSHPLNHRWSISFYLPIISNARSSLYEHDGVNRNSTHSFGIGDIRFAGYYWLIDPAKNPIVNVQLGLGLKLPSGDYRYQDYFHKNDSTKILGPVDQSIQLGDGGTGITLEANSYFSVSKKASLYFNGFYLANPRDVNGVSTSRGGTPSAATVSYTSDVMSVPDQYMFRAGANYMTNGFTISGGMRMEAVPAKDLIGNSNGFRRPGYVISVEPVIAYKLKSCQLYLSIPYAIVRDRTQSVPDKIRSEKTKVFYNGDAAFADYNVNFGISVLLK